MGPGLSCRGDSLQCDSCRQAGQQAASSMRGLRGWGAGSLWENSDCHCESHQPSKQLKANHLLITLPCPFNTHKTGCLFYFHGASVCKWKHALLPLIYPHQWVIEPNQFLPEEKKKWKKGICWFNNWNRLCYLFQKYLKDFTCSASYTFHPFYLNDTH